MAGHRILWMYQLPGLTPAIVEQELRGMGIVKTGDFNGRTVDLWPQAQSLQEDQWIELRSRCCTRCGVADYEEFYARQIRESPAYRRWYEQKEREGFFWRPPTLEDR